MEKCPGGGYSCGGWFCEHDSFKEVPKIGTDPPCTPVWILCMSLFWWALCSSRSFRFCRIMSLWDFVNYSKFQEFIINVDHNICDIQCSNHCPNNSTDLIWSKAECVCDVSTYALRIQGLHPKLRVTEAPLAFTPAYNNYCLLPSKTIFNCQFC